MATILQGTPTPLQVAIRLLESFSVVEAHPLFKAWAEGRLIDKEEYNQAFMQAIKSKEFEEARRNENAKPPALSLDDFLAMDFPAPEWLANCVIPKGGLVAISGKPGSYKSFFALWVAMRISAGLPLFEDMDKPFFCEQTTIATPTVFIEEENTAILMHSRAKGLRVMPGKDCYVRIDQGFKMQEDAWRAALLKDVEEKGIGLIVLDPFSSVMGLKDENNNAEVAVVMDLIRKEFIARGITVVFIHHPSKGDTDGKNLRGAGDILGKCDVHLHFEKDETDKRLITISYEKMRLMPDDEVVSFKIRLAGDPFCRDARFRFIGESETKMEGMKKDIERVMEIGSEYSRTEVAGLLGVKSGGRPFDPAWKSLLDEKRLYVPIGSRKFARKSSGNLT